MTPPSLSIAAVLVRLTTMRELLDVLTQLSPTTAAVLEEDAIRRLATERAITQLVELACDINTHVAATTASRVVTNYRESFDAAAQLGMIPTDLAASLKPSVGLRNVLTHEYVGVDLTIVAASLPQAITGYTEYVQCVATWVRSQSTSN